MAVSLALNWSPPASTSLFDDVSSSGDPKPTTSSSPSSSDTFGGPRRPSAPASSSNPPLLSVSPPARSMSSSPQPAKSYAAAASTGSSSSLPHAPHDVGSSGAPPPPLPGSEAIPRSGSLASVSTSSPSGSDVRSFQQQQDSDLQLDTDKAQTGQSVFFPSATANNISWQQYQQMVSEARAQASTSDTPVTGAGGPRRRTTSGPQKAPTTFQEADQKNPLPPLSYAPNSVPSHLRSTAQIPPMTHSQSASAVTGPGGYHPYRRTPRSSGASAAPVLPQIQFGSMLDGSLPPDNAEQQAEGGTHAASAAGAGPGAPSNRNAAPLSYSSVAAGALRGQAPNPAAPTHSGNRPLLQVSPTGSVPSPQTSASYASTRQGSFSSQASVTRRPSDSSSVTSPGAPTGFTHIRNASFSSQTSINTERERPTAYTAKQPSPLSQQGPNSGAPSAAQIAAQKKSLPNKLRKALSLSTMSEFGAADANGAQSKSTSRRPDNMLPHRGGGALTLDGSSVTAFDSPPATPDRAGLGSSAASISSRRSGRPPISGSGEGNPKRSLFNRKFNASTDNISISSTVSSASVMLRKMGNIGKLARRSSLMGITNMFKDKNGNAAGREGLHTDDFGTMTGSGAMADTTNFDNGAGPAANTKTKRGKNKKAAPVAAAITHATVELETGQGMMTPAATYVRQHQLQMQQKADAAPPASPQSQGMFSRMRNASADSSPAAAAAAAASSGANAQSGESRNQQMFEKEKEKLKKQRGWKKYVPGSGSSGSNDAVAAAKAGKAHPTGLETYAASDDENAPGYGNATTYSSVARSGLAPAGPDAVQGTIPISAAALYSEHQHDGYDEGDDADYLEPPHAPYAEGAVDSGDEYETDSLRHWGEGIERSRASAAQIKSVKGILKAKSAYGPEPGQNGGYGNNGPNGLNGARVRSSSFDATQGLGAPGVPLMSQMSNTTEGTDRMDGLSTARAESPSHFAGPSRSESPALKTSAAAGGENAAAPAPPLASPTGGVAAATNLGHHSNSSMPTLSLMMDSTSSGAGRRGSGAARQKKRLVFAESHIFHSTWPAHVYDRRGELATCNLLTPALAQRIKEELNSFKMEEMVVAPASRIYTHFFV
ncbi:bud neck involved protein [Tilletia horrida]|uniref:Bud neck involved protein n=1 Tax=Tilletia horrida TaxID=155126 RepID=A0AAN6GS94_9BASI|nr:bud neck involved protein [Tilletia horrida]